MLTLKYIAENKETVLAGLAKKGFKRVELSAGESQTVNFLLDSELLASINNAGERVILPGTYQVNIGESSPGSRSIQLGAAMAPVCEFQIKK